ncbi:nuclear pore complex protein Nup153 isoform X2 [Drosophila kikkawai]|uniref:Nuclear pore complex protein Nup153 n=1 Tax=Drosophila kikkawai TaxID=30033 RepID=A0A6P4JNG0_DROKI|nr:nuclear pore complex protein Nup153 isoform X2 [Drosophila kikkawai]
MSDPEDGQKVQRGPGTKARPAPLQAATPNQLHPLTPLKEVHEQEEEEEETAGASNNNTIMGKMKKRLSILPAALSGWFSPSSKPDAAASSPQQELHRQPNGCTKRKRGRRRIVLAEADAEADDVDDGSDARGLNYEEVALADNITEHDLAAEDEQTRRSEYNVFLLRRQRDALAATGGEEDDVEEDDVEEDVEEEECDEEDEDDVHGQVAKRQRLKMETTVSLPQMRRMPLSSSTPAASLVPASVSVGGARSNNNQLAPHRRTHLNLYQNQRNREPAFNFFTGNEAAAEGTTGDLPQSNRRSLNIPFGIVAGGGGGGSTISSATSRNNSSLSLSSLPNHKRPPLMMGKRPELRDRNLINSSGDRQHDLIINNNNNVEKPSRQIDLGSGGTTAPSGGGDSNSESDHVELNFHDNGDAHHNHNNSHLEFYGNLQSTKSLFNRTNAQPTLHNSTWSLNSLSNRRTFNASIYGSTSALSDSRLLSHRGSAASSASSSSSPFYQGPTAFGGNSANNRFFNRSSSAAPSSNSNSLLGNNSRFSMPGIGSGSIGMKPTEMRFNNPAETSGSSSAISKTTHRILHLLDRYSTPLIDVKRMGSVLKEHQSSRKMRNSAPAGSPYSLPRNSTSITGSLQSPVADLAELRSNKLLLPTMQQLLERRCLNRVTTNTRNLMQMPKQSVPVAEGTDTVVKAATKTVPSSVSAATPVVDQPSSHSHRSYKMRSKLSHQAQGRSKEVREEEAPPPPLDLPQISFPDMASTPKFDLVIGKTPGSHKADVPTTTVSKDNNSNTNNTLKKTNFLVNPQPINDVSLAANGASVTAAKRSFTFETPTPLSFNSQNTSAAQLNVIKRGFVFSAPIPLDAESKQVKAAMNGLPPQGFGEQFKKSGKEWDCDVCMVRNKAEAGKCVACETSKPGGVKASPAATTTLFEQFKKSSKEWDCEVCMVRNKVEVGKCVACETPKPKATALAAPSPLPPIVPIGGGFGDRFKKSSTAWECEACMVTNNEADSKCIACMTPRKAAMPTTKINNFPMTSVSGVGFGDAFKLKTGQWECQTCMVMNESTALECVACQTANPRLGSSEPSSSSSSSSSSSASSSTASAPASPRAANSVTSSTSFKFGFTPGTVAAVAPKQDAGFQQLVAAQKTASWNCDACLAQNEMSRNKCLCCEQLKPGSSPTSTTSTKSSGLTVPGGGSSVPKFTFGFAPVQPSKTGFTKEETKATTATSSTEETDAAAAPAPASALTQPFAFGAPPTLSSASSSTATTTTATISSTPALGGFSFGAPSSSSSTVSSSSANSMPVAKPMFSLSGAGGTASAVSSTSSSQQPASKTEAFGFGVSNAITTTTTSSTGFSLKPSATPATALQFAVIPASAADPAPAPAAAAAVAPSFSFGNPPKTVSTPAAAGTFFFGQPLASTSAPPAVNAGVSSIFGSTAAVSTSISTAAASSVSPNSTAVVAPSNPQPFSFGTATKKPEETTTAKPFVFGSGGLGATTTTTTTMPSFGWPSNGATGMNSSTSSGGSSAVTSTAAVSSSQGIMMTQPIFASSSAMFGAPSSITSSSSSSSLFGSTATTAAATPAAVSLGGNGGLATVFGNVGNSMVAPVATPAATLATAASGPLANIFGNPTAIAAPASSSSSSTSAFGSGSGGFGQGAAAATTPALGQGGGSTKPAFNFGGAVAATATSSGAPFNFGSSTAAAAKPTFNFTGSVTTASTPQAGAFTFTANPTAGPLAAGDAQGIFRFGAPSAAAEIGGAGLAGPGEAAASTSSFAIGGVPPMFNLSYATPQTEMQLQSASRPVCPKFADGSSQGAYSYAPPAAPVEMASQSAAKVAAVQAAIKIKLSNAMKRKVEEEKERGPQLLEMERLRKQSLINKYRYVRGVKSAAAAAAAAPRPPPPPEVVKTAVASASASQVTGVRLPFFNRNISIRNNNNRSQDAPQNISWEDSNNRVASATQPQWTGSGTAPATGANRRSLFKYVRCDTKATTGRRFSTD